MKITKAHFFLCGGIHPLYFKDLSSGAAIRELPIPAQLTVPMSQHLGAPAKPLVKVGDVVAKHQLIGEPGGFISAPVHAPAGGKVSAIVQTPCPNGRTCAAIVIDVDPAAPVEDYPAIADWASADPKALVARIGEAGIVGMGGAGFPTKVKLSPPPNKPIDTLILNGAECEPYLTADHRLMVEHAKELRIGAEIIRRTLGAKKLCVAIESNKPDAIQAMAMAFSDVSGDVDIVILPSSYPQGGEKQQIYSVTGRQVPRGGLPMDVRCVVENVGTVFAVYDAVVNGRPLTSRVTAVTGDAVANPGNWRAPCGTLYRTLVEACGGLKTQAIKVLSGGPMMGFTVPTLDVATTKTTSGITILTAARVTQYTSQACISCGRCVDSCPMRLSPCEMSQFIEADDIDGAAEIGLMDCIECGSCAFVCPARRPLVQHFRRGKAIIGAARAAAKAAAAKAAAAKAPAPAAKK